MKNEIEDNIKKFISIEDHEFKRFYDYLTPIKLEKGEVILRQGDVSNNAYFITKGCMKFYFLVDGDEKIGQFFFEGGWINDMYSFISRLPSEMNIAAIEDSEVLALNYENMQKIYKEIPKFERFGRLLIENIFVSSQQRTASFLTKSPTEKYLFLLHNRPKVVQRIPQYMIATYLGIKPESLSRIRKKIAQDISE